MSINYRRALISAGVPTAGLSPAEIEAKYHSMGLNNTVPAVINQAAQVVDIQSQGTRTIEAGDAAAQLHQALTALMAQQQAAPIDESRIIELIQTHGQAPQEIIVKQAETGNAVTVASAHPMLDKVVKLASVRQNVFLYGGAGSGKTTLAAQTAEALELDFYSTGAVLQKYELIGFIDAQGQYQTTEFRKAYEQGGVFLFDEFDSCNAGAIVAFNQALDNGLCPFPDGMVKQHPDFVCIAAGNTIGHGATRQYIGRNPLDGASLTRFIRLEVPYDYDLEKRLAHEAFKRAGGDDSNLWLVEWGFNQVRCLREFFNTKRWPLIMSPRSSMQFATMAALGFPKSEIIEAVLLVDLSEDQRRTVKNEHDNGLFGA